MSIRLLANENFPVPSIQHLTKRGYDIASILQQRPGISDKAVLQWAIDENRCILTFDRDYGELIFARHLTPPPAIIYLRLSSYTPIYPGVLIDQLISSNIDISGCFLTVDNDGIRRRPLPEK